MPVAVPRSSQRLVGLTKRGRPAVGQGEQGKTDRDGEHGEDTSRPEDVAVEEGHRGREKEDRPGQCCPSGAEREGRHEGDARRQEAPGAPVPDPVPDAEDGRGGVRVVGVDDAPAAIPSTASKPS